MSDRGPTSMLDQVVSPHCLQTNPNINISVPTEWTASMIQHSKHMFMMFIRGSNICLECWLHGIPVKVCLSILVNVQLLR